LVSRLITITSFAEFVAWPVLDHRRDSQARLPDQLPGLNLCFQLRNAESFCSRPDPYPEFVKRCFIFTDKVRTFLLQTRARSPRLKKPLASLVMAHYRNVDAGDPLFDMSRQRAWQIIKYMTGKWCHYFRSQRISFLVNKIRSTAAVAGMLGIKKSSTIDHYYKGGWNQFRTELAPEE